MTEIETRTETLEELGMRKNLVVGVGLEVGVVEEIGTGRRLGVGVAVRMLDEREIRGESVVGVVIGIGIERGGAREAEAEAEIGIGIGIGIGRGAEAVAVGESRGGTKRLDSRGFVRLRS